MTKMEMVYKVKNVKMNVSIERVAADTFIFATKAYLYATNAHLRLYDNFSSVYRHTLPCLVSASRPHILFS